MDSHPPVLEKAREADLAKIRSADLREAVSSSARDPQVVIVELDLAQKTVVRSGERFGDIGFARPRVRFQNRPDGSPDPAGIVADTSAGIAQILGKPPETYLSTSESFVLEANGEQLAQIAKLPAVSAIWPNTRRRVGY